MKKYYGILRTVGVLIMCISIYLAAIRDGSVRPVMFLSVLSIGMAAGVLLTQIFNLAFKKTKT